MFRHIRNPNERLRAVVDAAKLDGQRCYNPKTNITRFIQSAEQMMNTANWKKENGAEEEAFYLYIKFFSLYFEKVKQHPSFKQMKHSDQEIINKYVRCCLEEAETLKPPIILKYEEEEKLRQQKEAEEEAQRLEKEKAEYLAKQRISQVHRQHHDDAVLAQQMEQEEQYAFRRGRIAAQPTAPHIAQPVAQVDSPPLPVAQNINPPQPDTNLTALHDASSGGPSNTLTAPPPSINRSSKPKHHSAAFMQRKVILPGDLASTFLRLALNNTSRDIETCGILCAANSDNMNEFVVTHVLLPPQKGTPDSCITEDEEKLFQMTDQLKLVVVGWIHTHPSQTAFLSSVDLHTHAGYQLLLSESVAVVCSVKFDDNKVFRLTPSGLDLVSSCEKSGFHEHRGTETGEPLFAECSPEEVSWNSGCHVQVVDMRA